MNYCWRVTSPDENSFTEPSVNLTIKSALLATSMPVPVYFSVDIFEEFSMF